jgi:glutathione S-transferase
MLGDEPSIADFSLSGYLFYPIEEHGVPLAQADGPHPNLARWIERLRWVPGWGSPYDVLPGERLVPRW